MVEELRNQSRIHQISHCFIADLDGEVGSAHPEKNEIALGFEICFYHLDKAIEIMGQETPPPGKLHYVSFEIKRNLSILLEAKKVLGV